MHALWGDLGGLVDDVKDLNGYPYARFFYGAWTGAADGMVQVRLQPGEELVARLSQDTGSALTLLADCDDVSGALAFVHRPPWSEPTEIRHTNRAATAATYTLLLDALVSGGPFTLDVEIGAR